MQSGINHFRHKFGYIAAITSSRANHRGADRAEFTAGREQNRFNTTHSLIEVSHLEFVVEIATKSQPANDRVGSLFSTEIDQKAVNKRHFDTGDISDSILDEGHPLSHGEDTVFRGVHGHSDDDLVDEFGCPDHDVNMTEGDGVK